MRIHVPINAVRVGIKTKIIKTKVLKQRIKTN